MKRLIAAGIVLAFVLGVSVTGNIFINKYGSEAKEKIETVLSADEKSVLKKAEAFVSYWQEIRETLSIFVNHEDINEIGRVAAGMHSAAKSGDKDGIISAADEILFMLGRIEEDESLSLYSLL